MRVPVTRKNVKFMPDASRVVARQFMNGEPRTRQMLKRIMSLDDKQVTVALEQVLREFASRHRNISRIFLNHCANIQSIIEGMLIDYAQLTEARKMLIGSYCTMEYSIESAAFFNPSMIEDLDQSNLEHGEKRVIMSFRATGEGHISSVVFRRGILNRNNDLQVMQIGDHIDMAEISRKKLYDKDRFVRKLNEMEIPEKYSTTIMHDLPDKFEYYALKTAVAKVLEDTSISAVR